MKTVGEKIRALRESKKMTQEDMAYIIGLTPGAYAKIERDFTDVSLSRLEQIAKYHKLSVIELLAYGEKAYSDKCQKLLDEKDKEIMELQKKVIKLMEKR